MNILDTRTVLLSSLITSAICAMVMALLWRQNRPRTPELNYWLADFILQFLAILVIALRGVLPDVVSVVLGVPFSLAGALLLFIGLERYLGKTSAQRHNYLLLALFTLVHVYFAFGQPSLSARNINFSLGLLVFCGQCAWLLLSRADVNTRPETKALGVIFGVYTLTSVLRIFADLVVPENNDLFSSGLYDTLAILIYQILLIVLTFGLFLMVNRRLFAALESDIIERRRAEEASVASHAQLASIIDSAMDAIITVDAEQFIVGFNFAAEKMFGHPATKAIGQPLGLLIPEQFRAIHRQHFARFGDDRRTTRIVQDLPTLVGVRANGDEFPVEISISCVEVAGRRIYTAIARDVTERKRAEQEISSLARFPTENPYPVLRVRPNGEILYANAASDPVLAEWSCHGGDRLPVEVLRLVTDSVASQSKHMRDIDCGGRGFLFWAMPSSEVDYVNLYGIDITERKRTQELLTESELSYRRLFEAAKDGILILNFETGTITDVNPYMMEILGFTHAEFLDRKIWDLGFLKDVFASQANFEELKQKDYVHYENLPLETANGRQIDVEFVSNVYRVNHHKVIQCNIRDVSERKRAEVEIRELNADLERRVAKRTVELQASNQELEAFTYSVSHDLRAPLRAIDGYTQALLEEYPDAFDDEGRRLGKIVRDETSRMARLIDDLLILSRLTRSEMNIVPIDMRALVLSSFDRLTTPETRLRIDFRVNALPPADGDPVLIQRVWENLLANAIKFSSKRERAEIQVSGSVDADQVTYTVRDNGAGFDMQYASKLFGVFQRLHSENEFEGTGVGLAIVQRVIHRHAGRVWGEGQVDVGATFRFTLPTKTSPHD